jgi:hypothetical protein
MRWLAAAGPKRATTRIVALVLGALVCSAAPSGAEAEDDRIDAALRELESLKERDAERDQRIEELQREVDELREAAEEESAASAAQIGSSDVWSRDIRGTSLRLMDIGIDVLASGGSSTVDNTRLAILQAGEHDPRQRGFNLQQLELSFQGAVDPYLHAAAYLVYFLDAEGESRFEVEEAFALSQALPFGLADAGFQIEAGTFFTEFGYQNARHPHQWTFQDQPIVASRLLGSDGLRGPGFRVGWLMPLPWFSELHFGMQNATGETQVSFFANDEVYEERPIGGRPFIASDVSGGADFTYLLRWANGFDWSDSWSSQLGVSAAFGPNPTGVPAPRTTLYGVDFVAKWRPEAQDRGWPFVVLQAEVMGRVFEADAFFGDLVDDTGSVVTGVPLPGDTLHDWGLYVEGNWGFRRMWAVALRYEYATGSGGPSFDLGTPPIPTPIPSDGDPFRSTRHRLSPMVLFQPTEFMRLRLQYNYDHDSWLAADRGDPNAHSLWLGIEFSLGAHPAHTF